MNKKKLLIGALVITTVIGGALGFRVWTVHNIPYSYRQSLLDIIDYIPGKNVFHRSNSLM